MKLAPDFSALLLDAAKSLGSSVVEAPPEWTGAAFNAETLSTISGRPAFQRNESDLPSRVGAFRVDGAPLLIGDLTGPPNDGVVADQVRRYRNQAAIARSWLGNEGPNLQLFLIGPEGALSNRGWLHLAATIESDDRVCRKLVWLFSGKPSAESAALFLERTFVATPWDKEERVKARLDQIAEMGLPPGWQGIVDDEALDAEGLVDKIIDLEVDQL